MPRPLDYETPRQTHPPILLGVSEMIFIVIALAFVPLHALCGRNVLIPLICLLAFAAGAVAAIIAVRRSRIMRTRSLVAAILNGLAAIAVIGYLVYYWRVLEPLTMLGE